MAYAFTFDAYDNKLDPDGEGSSRVKSVDVTIVADNEYDAKDAAATLVVRDIYRLESIIELNDNGIPSKITNW
jgi:hypothetical protein